MNARAALLTALLAPLLVCAPGPAHAEPRVLEVTHEDGAYTVVAEMVLKAPADEVWRVLTDYPRLGRLSDSILESGVTEGTGGERLVDTVTRSCLGFFCRKVRHRQRMLEHPPTDIVATTVPEGSDFASGTVHWMVAPSAGGGTVIRYEMRVEPAFFIPPLFGQGMVRRALARETQELMAGIEREATR